MEQEVKKIKEAIEKALSMFLEQLDEYEIDVDCIDIQIEYNDGFHYLKLK